MSSTESERSLDSAHEELTPLERHAKFFVRASPDEVSYGDTLDGMRRLGVGCSRYVLAAIVVLFLGPLTHGKARFTVRVSGITRGKHPYDSGIFDDQGRFDPRAFEALFSGAGDAITADEMRAIIVARKNRRRTMGCVAGVLGSWFSGKEVRLLFRVAADTTKVVNGRDVPAMRRETLRRFYDGTLFPEIAQRARAGAR